MIRIAEDKCDFCGTCVAVCPTDAIELEEARLEILPPRCTDCELCIWVCPLEVLTLERRESGCETSTTASS